MQPGGKLALLFHILFLKLNIGPRGVPTVQVRVYWTELCGRQQIFIFFVGKTSLNFGQFSPLFFARGRTLRLTPARGIIIISRSSLSLDIVFFPWAC